MPSLAGRLNEVKQKQDISEEMNAEVLLTQAEMAIKQSEQDEVLAEILLNQVGGETDVI